jgi:hypothetical protein
LRALTVASIVIVGTLAVPSAAQAKQPEPAQGKVTFISGAEFREKRDAEKAEVRSGRQPAAKAESRRKSREEFLRLALEKTGALYLEEDLDVVEPMPGVVITLPIQMNVQAMAVEESEGSMIAEVKADWGNAASPSTHAGVGMAPYWSSGVSGNYLIEFWGGGEKLASMLSNWSRKQLLSDGNGTYDWWVYSRKAWGQSYDISGWDWRVTGMFMWNFPEEYIKPNLVTWEDMSPGSDFEGNCDTLPFTATVNTPIGASISFTDCDSYDMWFHPNVPGEYNLYFDQGAIYSLGNFEAAYIVTLKSKQGSSVWFNDVQRLEIAKYSYPAKTCTAATNGNGTCYV